MKSRHGDPLYPGAIVWPIPNIPTKEHQRYVHGTVANSVGGGQTWGGRPGRILFITSLRSPIMDMGQFGALSHGGRCNGHVRKTVVVAPRIALTKEQLEIVRKFEEDRKAGRVEFAFEGTILEADAFLRSTAEIVDCFNH